MDLFDVFLKKRVKSVVSFKAGPIIGIGQEVTISVFNVHLPAHELHLQQ
jgi:hypothetical protein